MKGQYSIPYWKFLLLLFRLCCFLIQSSRSSGDGGIPGLQGLAGEKGSMGELQTSGLR